MYITLASIAMVIPAFIIHRLIPFDFTSRLIDITIMCGLGLLMLLVYYLVTKKTGLLAKIFELEDVSLMKVLRKYRG